MKIRPSFLAPIALAFVFLGGQGAFAAEGCANRPETLGTSRTMIVDTKGGLFVGRKSYRQTLPLAAKEIVFTFDDGPLGKTTDAVLAALAAECVKATFFVVGQQARNHAEQLRRIEAAGHTIGHHSMTHANMTKISYEAGIADISEGWRTVDKILYGAAGAGPRTPFFRFPGFAQTKRLSAWLAGSNVGVFGTDSWGPDWTPIGRDELFKRALADIEAQEGGIFLLHDIHAKTAAMLPDLLRALKERGYKVVHIVPAGSGGATTSAAM